jgi:hypothetical protein
MKSAGESFLSTVGSRPALVAIFPQWPAQMDARQGMRQWRRRRMVGASTLGAKLRGNHVGREAVLRGRTDILALGKLAPPTANRQSDHVRFIRADGP